MQLSLGDTDRFLNIPEDTESTDRALLKFQQMLVFVSETSENI